MSQWLPVKAIYLAAFEVVICMAVCMNEEVLLKHVFNQMKTSVPIEITMVIGSIHSVISSLVVDTNWTIIVLIFQLIYAILLLVARTSVAMFLWAWLLTTLASMLEPARLAYLAEQIPPTTNVKSKIYFGTVVWTQFLAKVFYWIFAAHSDHEVVVRYAELVFASLISVYMSVIVALEWFYYDGTIVPRCFPVDFIEYSIVTERMLTLIGFAASGHHFALLVMDKTRISRLKSVLVTQNGISVSTLLALNCVPHVTALFLIPTVRFVKLTDLRLIGIGIIGTCVSLAFAGMIQGIVDDVPKLPQKREAVIQIANMLPSASYLNAIKFGLGSDKWVLIEPYSSVDFLVKGQLGKAIFPVTTMNMDSGTWEETLMSVAEGKSSNYVISEGKFVKIEDVQLNDESGIALSESKLIFLCLVENCNWTIEFSGVNYFQKIQLRDENQPVSKGFCKDTYRIQRIDSKGSNYLLSRTTQIETLKTYTVVVAKEDGVPILKMFETKQINEIGLSLFLIPEIIIGISSGLFELGMLHFLFAQTSLYRYPTYSHFFFLYKGVPRFIFAILQINLINYVAGYVLRFAFFYNVCSLVCFIILAYKY